MNKIEINIPEGFEIDNEKSNFSKGIIEFKPIEKKKLSYEKIANELFRNKLTYFLTSGGDISSWIPQGRCNLSSNASSEEQLECLMAYNKLRNVAVYLNKELKYDWDNSKYYIYWDTTTDHLYIAINQTWQTSSVYFSSKELAKQAIEILGEEEIKKALFIY